MLFFLALFSSSPVPTTTTLRHSACFLSCRFERFIDLLLVQLVGNRYHLIILAGSQTQESSCTNWRADEVCSADSCATVIGFPRQVVLQFPGFYVSVNSRRKDSTFLRSTGPLYRGFHQAEHIVLYSNFISRRLVLHSVESL